MPDERCPSVCPKCGQPEEWRDGLRASFACGTYVCDGKGIQSQACALNVACADLARVTAERDAARAEVERLRNPETGDETSQAAAWEAVWEALQKAGMLYFVGPDMSGRGRAVGYIAHLAAEVERLRAEVEGWRRLVADTRHFVCGDGRPSISRFVRQGKFMWRVCWMGSGDMLEFDSPIEALAAIEAAEKGGTNG